MKALILLSVLFSCNFSWALDLSWVSRKLNLKLLNCSRTGDLNCVEVALNRGANVMAREENWPQNTPLHIASFMGHLKVVQLLIQKNSTPEHIMVRSSIGRTPLHRASIRGNHEVVKFLIDQYPAPEHIMAEDSVGHAPLHHAALLGQLKVAQLLIEKYPVPEHIMARNDSKDTPLHMAIADPEENLEIIQLLITFLPTKEHIFAQDNNQLLAFELALLHNSHRSARTLFGHSPLHLKRQLIEVCEKNNRIDQKFCEQFVVSLQKQNSLEARGYE